MHKERKKTFATALVVAAALLSGCGSISLPGFDSDNPKTQGEHFIYQGHDFGPGKNDEFKKGITDGCTTASGNYAKDHTLYKNNIDYKTGWEDGRLKCGKSIAEKS